MTSLMLCWLLLVGTPPGVKEPDTEDFRQKQEMKETFLNIMMVQLNQEFDYRSSVDITEGAGKTAGYKATERQDKWEVSLLWSFLLGMVLLTVEFCRQDVYQNGMDFLRNNSNTLVCEWDEEDIEPRSLYSQLLSPHQLKALEDFYQTQVQIRLPRVHSKDCEFVEGLVDSLLDIIYDMHCGIVVEDCIGVGCMFEKWGGIRSSFVYDVLVPLQFPDEYTIHMEADDDFSIPPCKRGYGTIALVQKCSCTCSTHGLEGMLCLIHRKLTRQQHNNISLLESLLTSTGHFDAAIVLPWFGTMLQKAWSKVFYKYGFKISFSPSSPCRLMLVYPSNRSFSINIIPAVQYKYSQVYYVPLLPSPEVPTDIYWLQNFSIYEARFLKFITKSIPGISCHLKCLQTLIFLMECRSFQKADGTFLTSYHLKTVLLHLLVFQPPELWQASYFAERLCDILRFLGHSLDERWLSHFVIGNKVSIDNIPEVFSQAEPLNLFRPLVANKNLYLTAKNEYLELLSHVNSISGEEKIWKDCET
ncbi:inositol 1,4,5-trisphosphate receptor-interacting protein-like 1 [Polypterus senegalus]